MLTCKLDTTGGPVPDKPECDPAAKPRISVPVPDVAVRPTPDGEPQDAVAHRPSDPDSSWAEQQSLNAAAYTGAAAITPRPNPQATISMIMGIIAFGLLLTVPAFPVLASPIAGLWAIVSGLVGRTQIKRYGGIGIGRSNVGIALGLISLILFAVVVVGLALLLRDAWSGG